MSVYTVHQPPLRTADALSEPERFIFIRDGFYWWAFLLTPFWMLRHRLWLVFVIYLVITAALDLALQRFGASAFAITLIGILISLLVGFEAGTLWRLTLRRRRWANLGIVSGDDLEDAERRFFESWLRSKATRGGTPRSSAPAPTNTSGPPDVIGLFPEPGTQR